MPSDHVRTPHDHGSADDHMSQAFWDERYRSAEAIWSGQPNPQLVAEAAGLAPGTALDVGCGEGADAVWLAQRGWQVTAVDISAVALERASAHARETGADVDRRITWLRADVIGGGTLPRQPYDLVSAQFMQVQEPQRGLLQRRLAASVAVGGTLLIVGHSPRDLGTTAHRPHRPEVFFTARDAAATLHAGEWAIVVSEARPRAALDPDGVAITVYDEVLNAVRLIAAVPVATVAR